MHQLLCFFFSLVDQVKSPHCKATVGVLHAAKSRSLKHWKELVINLVL